ncbi:MAG: hypothetical protein H7833_05205 [Magnetococcus sp. DMHC-1]|nr:hypothetical protein [Magnetococcales bacterium]
MTITPLFRHPFFLVGMGLRLLLIFWAEPWVQSHWFVPFLQEFLRHPTLNPWTTHLLQGGDGMAFPYGLVMFLVYLPGVALGTLLDHLWQMTVFSHWGFALTNLGVDLAILFLLLRILEISERKILLFYWLSPIVLYVGYWYGQTDLVPLALLMAAFLALHHNRFQLVAICLAMSISAKLSFIVAVPFFLFFFINNRRYAAVRSRFMTILGVALVLLNLPLLTSSGGMEMILNNREMAKPYWVRISVSAEADLFVAPLVYLLVLFHIWRQGRMNREMLFFATGLGFMNLVTLTPSSVGWFVWIVPFLVACHGQVRGWRIDLLSLVYSILFLILAPINAPGASLPWLQIDFSSLGPAVRHLLGERGVSLIQTGLTGVGAILGWWMFARGIVRDTYSRLTRKPLVIGISGDSGSGKDYLAHAMAHLFGNVSVVEISGDDYHLWDRYAPMWKALTHLNPKANDLKKFHHDLESLVEGHIVLCRRYDHKTGRFSPLTRVEGRDVVIASGLHALHLPELLDLMDVRVFLDMDEGLRRHLKIQRDVHKRGRSFQETLASLEKRQPDRERFILPQARHADITFRLQPILPLPSADDADSATSTRLIKLGVTLQRSPFYEDLLRVLIGLLGLFLESEHDPETGLYHLTIEGRPLGTEIQMAARLLIPQLDDLTGLEPQWHDGMTGLMQLIVLLHAVYVLKKDRS